VSRAVLVKLAGVSTGVLLGLFSTPLAQAQDPYADLAAAQEALAEAEAQLQAAEAQAKEAQVALAPVEAQTEAATSKANAATGKAERIEGELVDSREDAAQTVEAAGVANDKELDAHEEDQATAIGVGLGLAVLALVVLFWQRVRESSVLGWLADQTTGRAIGICVGAAFVGLVLAGALLESAPLLGTFLFVLGLGLPVLGWMARHSIRVARGDGTALYLTDRLGSRGLQITAALIAVVALMALVVGLTSGEPELEQLSAETVRLAKQAADDPADPPTPALIAARKKAEPLVAQAEDLRDEQAEARAVLASANRKLDDAVASVSDSKDEIEDATKLIAEQEAQAERQAARAAAAAERAAEEADGPSGGGCTPGYSPCLPPASDYDCEGGSGDGPEYTGVVSISGSDPYDLDADGDGTGCD
jgi:hypothetical protein